MAVNFIETIRDKAKNINKSVAFPNAEDVRAIDAAIQIKNQELGNPILVGNPDKIAEIAKAAGLTLNGVEILNPVGSEYSEEFTAALHEKRKHKGMTPDQAAETVKDPLYFAGLLLETGRVDAVVGGNVSSTGDVLRSAIHTVGVEEGISIVSSYFIMVFSDRMYCFADCAVNPEPTDAQLADIAISSAKNYNSVTGEESKAAMLSFSTKGSASHELVEKIQRATNFVKEKAPELPVDGELQLDAAVVSSVGERKSPGSPVAGNANVLIFPDLNSGNIGYKLTQRLAGAEAVGPIIQGLKKPYCDLSRGCSVDDMINVACICMLMA